MRIILTGVTGFIGKNFIKSITQNQIEYVCLVRESSKCDWIRQNDCITVVKTNFTVSELERLLQCADIVVHMIGQMGSFGIQLDTYTDANINLTRNILDACIKNNVKQFIYLSTPGVQGFGKRLCKEEEAYNPRNVYEQTKMQAEQLIVQALKNSETQYTILRPDFVYGPEDTRRITLYKNIRDKKFVLTTSGKSYLHPTFVADVVQGIQKAIENPHAYNEIFNLSAQNDMLVQDYLNIIADYFHVKLLKFNIGYFFSCFLSVLIDKFSLLFLKREGFVSKNKIDFLALNHSTSNEKAKKLLGYSPQYDFEQGFALTMKWCEENNLL